MSSSAAITVLSRTVPNQTNDMIKNYKIEIYINLFEYFLAHILLLAQPKSKLPNRIEMKNDLSNTMGYGSGYTHLKRFSYIVQIHLNVPTNIERMQFFQWFHTG